MDIYNKISVSVAPRLSQLDQPYKNSLHCWAGVGVPQQLDIHGWLRLEVERPLVLCSDSLLHYSLDFVWTVWAFNIVFVLVYFSQCLLSHSINCITLNFFPFSVYLVAFHPGCLLRMFCIWVLISPLIITMMLGFIGHLVVFFFLSVKPIEHLQVFTGELMRWYCFIDNIWILKWLYVCVTCNKTDLFAIWGEKQNTIKHWSEIIK